MKRFVFELTDELFKAIEAARGDADRNPKIEQWLWRLRPIRTAAEKLGVKRSERRKPGRPKGGEDDA